MANQLTKEDVLKLANLAKLKLSEQEIKRYQVELSNILEYVEQLSTVDTEGLKPTYQVTGLKNVFRDDVVQTFTASAEDLMKIVPKSKDGFIEVKRMI